MMEIDIMRCSMPSSDASVDARGYISTPAALLVKSSDSNEVTRNTPVSAATRPPTARAPAAATSAIALATPVDSMAVEMPNAKPMQM